VVSTLALLVDLASTLFMTGLIWFVDRVHYPLFARVAREAFRDYHAEHTRRTAEVVLVPMILELVTSIVLVVWPPSGSGAVLAWAGLVAALVSWSVTAAWAVPMHRRLALGFDPGAHRALARADGVRAVSWTAHAAILLVMTARALA
jgi:hypothetical protein